jgi:enolase
MEERDIWEKGVKKAIENINEVIAKKLKGLDVTKQKELIRR